MVGTGEQGAYLKLAKMTAEATRYKGGHRGQGGRSSRGHRASKLGAALFLSLSFIQLASAFPLSIFLDPLGLFLEETPSEAPTTPAPPLNNADENGLEGDQSSWLNNADNKEVCGLQPALRQGRIVGGQTASPGKWPWQVSVGFYRPEWDWTLQRSRIFEHTNGAALLNKNWAVTAAHCLLLFRKSNREMRVRVGVHDRGTGTDSAPFGFEERRVAMAYQHPEYFNDGPYANDLALLRFDKPIRFQQHILPICLPDDSADFVGQTAYVTGWGVYNQDVLGLRARVLRETYVPVISNSECENKYPLYANNLKQNIFLCAGWDQGGFDACQGDSGGPLMIKRSTDKRWVLAGITSWGKGCGVPNQPGVYTRISEFRDFINKIIEQ